ncbi:hypothetical protein REPUB_Repub11eG0113700 [Reevesia pubescens]
MAKTNDSLIDNENMEKGLLVSEREVKGEGLGIITMELDKFIEEAKRVGYIAGPMVAVNFSQYFLQVISVMMVGHLGELSLSSTAIAISFCGVTGFSLLAQSLIFPMLVSSCSTLCFHILLCWALVFKYGLRNQGAALAISISYWINVISLALYMVFSDTCKKTRVPITMDVFQGIPEFFRFAIPSAFMICLATMSTLFPIPEAIVAAASTRVSNELGAGNPHLARVAVFTALSITVLESIIVSAALFSSRHVFGYVFSNEKEVVEYVTNMAPLLSISVGLDSLQVFLSGIARGSGWQDLGAYINLAAYYLCGVPVSAILGFWFQMKGKGLWIGISWCLFANTSALCHYKLYRLA